MKILSLMLMIGLLLATASCDDTFIDPFDNDARYYTIYGFLDVRETEHAVRVIPVTRFPERITSTSGPQSSIDATVTSTDLHTGATIIWRHNLEKLSDGTYGHSRTLSRGPYTRGELRIDPAPRWNRDQTAILVPAMTDDETRQLHLIEIEE